MLSLRRRHSRWRMFPILLFLGMICSGELAPVRVPEETLSASSSTPKKKDIGSLNEHWETWILVDSQGGFQPSLDSATLLRRITPKSVFIAPVLPACAEGYHADKMGRCVKSISINVTAHKDFIRERLKLMFGNTQASKNDQKKSTGPLQLNIPLVPDINRQVNSNLEFDQIFSTNKPIAVPTRNETYFTGNEETKPHETSLYVLKNGTTLNEEKSTFFLGNSNSKDVGKIDRKPPAAVSIAELIEEMNNTNLSEVVDYKIPMDNPKILLNSSSVKKINASDGTEENVMITEKQKNFTETPAQVLVSLTKLTNVLDDLSLTNDTAEQIAQVSNFTSNTTKKSITVRIPDSTTLPTKQLTSTSISLDEQRDNETYAEDELEETSKPNESQEADLVYDEEEDMDYPYNTDVPDDEDSTEGEEILKHGEAGITIPTRNVERDRDRHQRQRNQTADLQKKMLDIGDQVMIRFNDSAPAEDKDEAGSNISSEVSIDGDFILETTILDVNTERLQFTTQSPDVTEKIVEEGGSKKSFGKNPDVVPEVIFPQDVHGAGFTNSHGHDRTEKLSTRIENERHEELEAAPSSSESLLYDSPEEDPITEIHMINDKQSSGKESVRQESSKDSQSNVPVSSPKRTTMNLDSVEDFVKFPNYVMQPQRSNYVIFPSSEANSIHSPSYKQNSRYSTDDVSSYGTSTKSSVPIRQKPVYYLTASSWKLDERQNRKPDLVHFWSKMPLIRDPAMYPIYQDDEATDDDQKQSHDRFRPSRRLSPFAETSPRNRVPTQKRRTPIGG